MPKTATIRLGDEDYVIHPFNLGELEEVALLMEGPSGKVPFGLLRIALRRGSPPSTPNEIEATTEQVRVACDVILQLAGLGATGSPPQPAGSAG